MRIFRGMSVVGAAVIVSAALITVPLTPAAAVTPPPPPGAPGSSFGTQGQVALDTGIDGALDSAAVGSLGRIVVGGKHGNDIWVYRLTTRGSLGSPFASGGTYKWVGAAGAGGDPAGAITVDSTDRVYATGTAAVLNAGEPSGGLTHQEVAILRLSSAGQADSSWSASGVVTYNFVPAHSNDHGTSLALDESEHRLYVGAWEGPGAATGNNGTDFAVLAYDTTSAGQLDSAHFATGGVATLDLHGTNDTVRDIAVMPGTPSSDPRAHDIVATGFAGQTDGSDSTAVWMLKDNGGADNLFGGAAVN